MSEIPGKVSEAAAGHKIRNLLRKKEGISLKQQKMGNLGWTTEGEREGIYSPLRKGCGRAWLLQAKSPLARNKNLERGGGGFRP